MGVRSTFTQEPAWSRGTRMTCYTMTLHGRCKPPSNLWLKIYHATMIIASTHYNDVIMSAMASQITSLTIVYSTIYSKPRLKKTSKLCVTGLCEGNPPVTGECPSQRASNAENVSIWWRHHAAKMGHHKNPSLHEVSVINNHQLAKTYWLIFYWRIFNGYYNWA